MAGGVSGQPENPPGYATGCRPYLYHWTVFTVTEGSNISSTGRPRSTAADIDVHRLRQWVTDCYLHCYSVSLVSLSVSDTDYQSLTPGVERDSDLRSSSTCHMIIIMWFFMAFFCRLVLLFFKFSFCYFWQQTRLKEACLFLKPVPSVTCLSEIQCTHSNGHSVFYQLNDRFQLPNKILFCKL